MSLVQMSNVKYLMAFWKYTKSCYDSNLEVSQFQKVNMRANVIGPE